MEKIEIIIADTDLKLIKTQVLHCLKELVVWFGENFKRKCLSYEALAVVAKGETDVLHICCSS